MVIRKERITKEDIEEEEEGEEGGGKGEEEGGGEGKGEEEAYLEVTRISIFCFSSLLSLLFV